MLSGSLSEELTLSDTTWQLIIAVFALLGPALVLAGLVIGRMQEKNTSAHKRIDKLELNIDRRFDQLHAAIQRAWRACPLVHDHKED
jgi:hypothetical protein